MLHAFIDTTNVGDSRWWPPLVDEDAVGGKRRKKGLQSFLRQSEKRTRTRQVLGKSGRLLFFPYAYGTELAVC